MSENSLRSVLEWIVAKWRKRTEDKWDEDLGYTESGRARLECADELRAALAATQEPQREMTERDEAFEDVRVMLEEQKADCLRDSRHETFNRMRADELDNALINLRVLVAEKRAAGAPDASGRETVATAFIRPINEGFTPGCISGCSTGTDGKFHHHPYCETYGHKAVLEIAGKKWVDETRYNGALIGIDPEQSAAPRPELAPAPLANVHYANPCDREDCRLQREAPPDLAWAEGLATVVEALAHIIEVASGERQVANDDTEGMAYIDEYARAALADLRAGKGKLPCNCGADRTGPSAEAHRPTCPQA